MFVLIRLSLLIYILFGLAWDRSSLIENLSNEYNFINLIPELVEKKEPPIITKIKNKKNKLLGVLINEITILDILLVIENKIEKKL